MKVRETEGEGRKVKSGGLYAILKDVATGSARHNLNRAGLM